MGACAATGATVTTISAPVIASVPAVALTARSAAVTCAASTATAVIKRMASAMKAPAGNQSNAGMAGWKLKMIPTHNTAAAGSQPVNARAKSARPMATMVNDNVSSTDAQSSDEK